MGTTTARKIRFNKKTDVRPTVHTELKAAVYNLAEISDISVMALIEEMVIYALNSKPIIEGLSNHFIRSVRFKNSLYHGRIDAEFIGDSPTGVNYVRMKTRLTREEFEGLKHVADGLDVKPARACSILIHEALHCQDFLDNFIKKNLQANITDSQLLELKKIIEYVNRDEHYNVSWATLLSYIMTEIKDPVKTIKEKATIFINYWRDR